MIKKSIIIILVLFFKSVFAQETVVVPNYLNNVMDSITKQNFIQSLDSFFSEIEKGKIKENLLTFKNAALTKTQLQELVNYEKSKDSSVLNLRDKKLINVYPISSNEYFIKISYSFQKEENEPVLIYIISLIATKNDNKFTFSLPIDYLTRYWEKQTIGNVTYHFRDSLNAERAILFDKKNTEIAKKLKLEPERLDFYMTDNYQEILELLGFEYSFFSNGKYRDGYGVISKKVFAIMNNEDFSHDMFHYYSSKINKRENRNWIAEEGLAYLWGNAYYTDKNGEIITHKRLVDELKNYLSKNPTVNLYNLFSKNEKIYNEIAPEISVRSTISGIIAREIETKKGYKGILKLINAGREDRLENYLKVTNELIGIHKENFNLKVKKLISEF